MRLSLQPSTISVVTSDYDDNYFRLLQFTSSRKKNEILMHYKKVQNSFRHKTDMHWGDLQTKKENFISYPKNFNYGLSSTSINIPAHNTKLVSPFTEKNKQHSCRNEAITVWKKQARLQKNHLRLQHRHKFDNTAVEEQLQVTSFNHS